jgi:hypothetical protein
MAGDVKISTSIGTAIGATIVYPMGGIPYAAVDIIPSGGIKISQGGLPDIDSQKRQEASVSVSVKSNGGRGGSLNFKGVIDGMSVNNMVGQSSYQAIIKNAGVCLLEATTLMPGLIPSGINVYKMPNFGATHNSQGGDDDNLEHFVDMQDVDLKKSPIEVYTEILKKILQMQVDGSWEKKVGLEEMVSGGQPFEKIFNGSAYKKTATNALKYISTVDLSAVTSGAASKVGMSDDALVTSLMRIFKLGPQVVLENYLNFLRLLGCTVIFSNSKMYVVPENSTLKQGGKGINSATPNDYNAYSYNDNGYRDIGSCIVLTDGSMGGFNLASKGFDSGTIGCFEDAKVSKAGGTLIVSANPFMAASANAPAASDSKKIAQKMDNPGDPLLKSPATAAEQGKAQSGAAALASGMKNRFKKVGSVLDNYAQSVLYQARYGDRTGSVTMEFNPNWVPGTGGSIFIKQTNTYIHFNVTTVTHMISTAAPTTGTAITTVSFNCGRVGQSPAGLDSYKYFGYDSGKEKGIQGSYIGDS